MHFINHLALQALMARLFGTNGVRGHVGTTMTPELALRLGRAYAMTLPVGATVAIGRDARDSGPMLAAAFSAGLHASGIHTVDVGVLASPGIQLFVRDRRLAGGGIVTASHNPPQDNGIKVVAPDGTEASPELEDEIERHFRSGESRNVPWEKVGRATTDASAAEHYLEAVLKQVDVDSIRKAKLTVVCDPGGGAGCVTAPQLLERLGVKVVRLACDLDGAFTSRNSEPTPENAKACMDAVRRHKADLGVLQDGDADRAVFVDEKGDYVWGDTSLSLGVLWELRRHAKPGALVCTALSSSSCVEDAARMAGGHVEWTVVGSPLVARAMLKHGAIFGGEDNGGMMFARHQVCRDGLMAIAFVLEVIAKSGRTMSQLCAEVPRYALVKQKVEVAATDKEPLLARLRTQVPALPGVTRTDTRDGVKAWFKEGWVLVRPSGTEPIFRIQAEAKDEATAKALAARVRPLLEPARTQVH